VTPRRRERVFAERLWNRFKGDPDKPYLFQPRVKPGVDEKILSRVVADQIQPEVWITTKANHRHPDPDAQPHDGMPRTGNHRTTPEKVRRVAEALFPKGRALPCPDELPESHGLRGALAATAGIDVGNPLIQDERVSIKYP